MARRNDRDFVAWAREAAVPLDLDSPAQTALALEAFDPLLDGKRIAFLGESNHWIHEKYAVRESFLRYLAGRGFGAVGEELSWSDGQAVDDYLSGRDADALATVTAYGYEGCRRDDRDDEPKGVLRDAVKRQPTEALAAEQAAFARAFVEAPPPGGPQRFFGLDVDYVPSVGYERLAPVLARGGAVGKDLLAALERVAGESLGAEIQRLERVSSSADSRARELDSALGIESGRDVRRGLRTLWLSHEYMRIAHAAPDYAALAPALALRERLMGEHVEHVLARLGHDEKLVLMSHDLHLAKDDRSLRVSTPVSGPGGDRAPALGTQLHDRYGGEVVAIWMLEDSGRDARPIAGSRRIRSVRGSLNALLAQVGGAFALPTRSKDPRARRLAEPNEFVTMYDNRVRGILADQTDIIAFVPTVTPLKS